MKPSVRMFVSYSHENAAWCKRILPVLKVKANVDTLQPWHDTEIKAGDHWEKEIRAELDRMDIFLCLVSYQFLASSFIHDVELPTAEARHKNGEIEVVPVVVYPMDLKATANFSISSIRCPDGVSAGGILKRKVTGTTRFIQSVRASSRRSRKRASDELRARILMRVDSGSGYAGVSQHWSTCCPPKSHTRACTGPSEQVSSSSRMLMPCVSFVRVKGLALKPLDERSLPSSAASDYDQLHLSQRQPLRPARCKVVVEDFARKFGGSFLRTENLLKRRPEHFIRQAQTGISVEKQLLQPL
jgi:hypothetical protein